MAINPKIKQKAEDIRSKIFGSEVRESLASGIEAISEDVEETIGRQGYVEEQFQDVLDETTGKDVISAPELIAARNGKSNLKTRLDEEHAQVTAQLQQTEQNLTTARQKTALQLRKERTENNRPAIKNDKFEDGLFNWITTDGIVVDETTKDLTITSNGAGNHLNVALYKSIKNTRGIEITLGSLGVANKLRVAFGKDLKNFAFTVNNVAGNSAYNYTDYQRVSGGALDLMPGGAPVGRTEGNDFIPMPGDRVKAVVHGQHIQLFHNGVLKSTLVPSSSAQFALPNEPLMAGVSFRDEGVTGKYSIDKVKVFPKVIDRYMHLSIDDFIAPLKELTTSAYVSIFEQSHFAWLKYLHETYGAVFTLNLYHEDGLGWSINSMTDRYKNEFRLNSDWLKFTFHAKNANSDYQTQDTTTALADYTNTMTQIKRFSSAYNIDRVSRIHFYKAKIETARAWKNAGCLGFLTADDDREINYYLNSIQKDTLVKCDDFYDETEGLYFVKTVERLEFISDVTERLNTMRDDVSFAGQQNTRILFAHEPVMLYGAVKKNFEDACKWALENDYIFAYPSDFIPEC